MADRLRPCSCHRHHHRVGGARSRADQEAGCGGGQGLGTRPTLVWHGGLNIQATRASLRRQKEEPMPEINVNLVAGRSDETKKALMYDITQAVMKNCNVPAEAVVVQIVESQPGDKMKGGQTFVERMKK